jgi:hypothetical protein
VNWNWKQEDKAKGRTCFGFSRGPVLVACGCEDLKIAK